MLERLRRVLEFWAPIAGAVFAGLAILASVCIYALTVRADNRAQAFEVAQKYYEFSADHPDLSAVDRYPELVPGNSWQELDREQHQYYWYAADGVQTAEIIFVYAGNDPGWRETAGDIVQDHAGFIRYEASRDPDLCNELDSEFVKLIESEVDDVC